MSQGTIVVVNMVSAGLGVLFALSAVWRAKDPDGRSTGLYLLARSAGLLFLAAAPLVFPSRYLLLAATGMMLLVQGADGLVGLCRRSVLSTVGPFCLAALHGICLAQLL